MRIAVAGKGGVGKTTISGTLARLLSRRAGGALAVDGDSNPNLGVALGLPQATAMDLPTVPRDVMARRRDADGEERLALAMTPEEIASRYGIDAPDGVRLLILGKVGHAGTGWMCRNHATVRSLLAELVGSSQGPTIADMEAGLENFSRGTPRHVDTLFVVMEPYFRSLETASRAVLLGRELGIPRISAIANKVRTPEDEVAIRDFCGSRGIDVAAWVPFDETVLAAERAGLALLDAPGRSPAVTAISALADSLELA